MPVHYFCTFLCWFLYLNLCLPKTQVIKQLCEFLYYFTSFMHQLQCASLLVKYMADVVLLLENEFNVGPSLLVMVLQLDVQGRLEVILKWGLL